MSVCEDQPDDLVVLCDWRNTVMSLGGRYKGMVTFRLAIRQYVIKREFKSPQLDLEVIIKDVIVHKKSMHQ
jgi:hypothetical protein